VDHRGADDALRRDVLEDVFRCAVVVDVNPTSGRPLVRVAWPEPRARR